MSSSGGKQRFVYVLKFETCKIRQNIKIFNIVLDYNNADKGTKSRNSMYRS